MNTISLIARSNRPRAEASTLLGRKHHGLKVVAGTVLAIPFATIAFSMMRMFLVGF